MSTSIIKAATDSQYPHHTGNWNVHEGNLLMTDLRDQNALKYYWMHHMLYIIQYFIACHILNKLLIHEMETFSALLAICAGNSPVTGINGWVNNHEAGELRRHCTNYDVTVINDATMKMLSR